MQNVVLLWSTARILRGVAAYYESDLFFDYFMIEEEEKKKELQILIPILIILFHVVAEIIPFGFVLDYAFMEQFVSKPLP